MSCGRRHPLARKRGRDSCTKLVLGTVSERPKVQLSKSCVGVEPTVGSNPTGSARGLLANLHKSIRESKPKKEKATGSPVAFSFCRLASPAIAIAMIAVEPFQPSKPFSGATKHPFFSSVELCYTRRAYVRIGGSGSRAAARAKALFYPASVFLRRSGRT